MMMKDTAFFVNTARGQIVNEPALTDVFRERRIAGATLDVQANEPLHSHNPLLELDNIIVSPHIASYTRGTSTLRPRASKEP